MNRETNELGEVYEWEYTPTVYTTWDDADHEWESVKSSKPWATFGTGGGWRMITHRNLHLGDSGNNATVKSFNRDIVRFNDTQLNNNKNDYAIQQVEVKDGKSSLAEIRNFALNGAPYGYEEIRPLIPGEYTYEKALIGIRVRKNSPEVTVGFEGAILNVDVEDVVDKGTVEVTSTDPNYPTSVTYGKWYYNKPEELMFSVSNFSEPCVVEVLTSDDKGFTLMLKSTIDNTKYVTGTVHWLANGY